MHALSYVCALVSLKNASVVCATGKGKIDVSWKAAQAMMKDVNAFLDTLLNYKGRIDGGGVPPKNFENIRPLLELEHFNVRAHAPHDACTFPCLGTRFIKECTHCVCYRCPR